MDWAFVVDSLAALQGWVDTVRGWHSTRLETNREESDRLIEAMVTVHRAANLTRALLADAALWGPEGNRQQLPARLRSDDFRDLQRGVSDAWVNAAGALARCEADRRMQDTVQDLYRRCLEKAAYWADPVGWRSSGVDIRLAHLVSETTEVIELLRQPPGDRRPRLVRE